MNFSSNTTFGQPRAMAFRPADLPGHDDLFDLVTAAYLTLPKECRRDFLNQTLATYHAALESQHGDWTLRQRGRTFLTFTLTLLNRVGLKIGEALH